MRLRNFVKLQLIKTKLSEKVYIKHQIVIPNSIVAQLNWNPNDEVIFEIDRKGRLILQTHQPISKENKITYDRFRDEIHRVLISNPKGLTWLKICEQVPSLPAKPNALWVKRLEDGIGLIRMIEAKTYRKLWRLRKAKFDTLNGWTSESTI